MGFTTRSIAIASILLVAACAEREEILPGERLDLRGNALGAVQTEPKSLSLPAARNIASWTHRGGNAAHNSGHHALRSAPTKLWSAAIGQPTKKRVFQAAEPVVGNGRIYTMDAVGLVSAFNLNGGLLWQTPITSLASSKSKGKISGGGLALQGNNLAVTTGSGLAVLLNASTGQELWQQQLSAASTTAPALSASQMVVVDGQNRAVGLSVSSGRILWQQRAIGTTTSVLGTGSPALSGSVAIVPFNSGEIQGISTSNGLQIWSQTLSGSRVGVAKNTFGAVSGDPVIVGNRIFVSTFAGRMAAIDRRSGLRIWTAKQGAIGPVIPAGGSLFILSDERKVKRLSAADGSEIWSTSLPIFEKIKRQKGNIGHYGPVLAGGQLWVAGSDGFLRAFDPKTGVQTRNIALGSGAASQPIVAGGRLYVITENGQLHAFQ